MIEPISKSEFKSHALEVLWEIERSGESRIITDRGRPTLEIRKLKKRRALALDNLKGTVVRFEAATEPLAEQEWDGL